MDSNKEYFITKELKNNNLEVKILGLSLILKRECSIIQNNKNSEDILEKEIYFKGGMDSYYYFKRIGVIN